MTLSTESVRHSATTARTSKPHSHKAAAAPPAPPFEPVDSVKIATPQQAAEAARTPVLDPGLQCALLTGLMQVAGSMDGSAVPLVTVDAALKGMKALNYTLDLKKGDQPLSSNGAEKITTSKDQATFTNGPKTELRLGLDTKTKKLQVDGKLDGYATHLQISMNQPTDKDDDVQGFHTEGTIGGQAYEMDSSFTIDPSTRPPEPPPEAKNSKKKPPKEEDEVPKDGPPPPPPPPELGTMQATGHIGDQKINANYKFSEQQQPFGATMDFKGTTGDIHLSLIA